jgi:hypothetical protein
MLAGTWPEAEVGPNTRYDKAPLSEAMGAMIGTASRPLVALLGAFLSIVAVPRQEQCIPGHSAVLPWADGLCLTCRVAEGQKARQRMAATQPV